MEDNLGESDQQVNSENTGKFSFRTVETILYENDIVRH